MNVLHGEPGEETVTNEENPLRTGDSEFLADRVEVGREILPVRTETEATDLQGAKRLLEGFLESAADGHRLADTFHLGGQRGVSFRKFLESEPRNFRHDIVN